MAALERLRARVPADLPFIADAKRGDIGSTAARQAAALFDHLGADAVTASPYLGRDAVAPLLEHEDRFVYVLCRTSNPGAGEIQDLRPTTASRCTSPSRAASRAWSGAAATTRPGRRRDRARPSWQRVRSAARSCLSSCPAWARRVATSRRSCRVGPATQGQIGPRTGGSLLVNVSRGIAAAAHSAVGDPPRPLLGGKPVLALGALATGG